MYNTVKTNKRILQVSVSIWHTPSCQVFLHDDPLPFTQSYCYDDSKWTPVDSKLFNTSMSINAAQLRLNHALIQTVLRSRSCSLMPVSVKFEWMGVASIVRRYGLY